jgi:L-alanine-DL-glutamate epimerase-like enolase superfamily enzyme
MKIRAVEVERYSWARSVPITDGNATYTHVNLAFVKVHTDEGVTGIGLGAGGAIEQAAVEKLAPLLIGEDPVDVERLWPKMWVPKLMGRRGLTTRAISSIDMALWDIRGKLANMPLYKLLGGYRDRVPTYIAGGYYEPGKGLKELAAEMEESVRMGARAVKMKVGGAPMAEDVERVRVVRDAIGPAVTLMVDANCAYRAYEAIRLAVRIEPYDIFWFEEPVMPDDYEGHRKVARATSIPVATGENEYTRYGFRDLIRNDCAAILNPDVKVVGGVTEFMKVVALAQAADLHIAPHGSQDIHIHLTAAVANGLILEFYRDTIDPMWGRVYHNTLVLNDDGTVSPPNVPGIGLDPNYEALAPHRVG